MWSIAGLLPAMLHMKACWNPKGGHKPCLCEGVAGLRPATPSHRHGQYCFWSAEVGCGFQGGREVVDENVIGWKCFGWRCQWMKTLLDEIVIGWNCSWKKVSLDENVFGWKCILPVLVARNRKETTYPELSGDGRHSSCGPRCQNWWRWNSDTAQFLTALAGSAFGLASWGWGTWVWRWSAILACTAACFQSFSSTIVHEVLREARFSWAQACSFFCFSGRDLSSMDAPSLWDKDEGTRWMNKIEKQKTTLETVKTKSPRWDKKTLSWMIEIEMESKTCTWMFYFDDLCRKRCRCMCRFKKTEMETDWNQGFEIQI